MDATEKPTGSEALASRLRYLVERSKLTQTAFARRIGVDPSNLSKYLLGRLPVTDALVNRIVLDLGVSRAWLRDGEGVPFDKELHAREIAVDEPLLAAPVPDGVPVYDLDVMAGTTPLSQAYTDAPMIGRVSLPRISPDSMFVRVDGDSMVPVLRPGAFINIRLVSAADVIFWGQIYVVVLEDYRMVKFVRRNADASMVTLHSANPAYDDIELPRRHILELYLVEGVITYEQRC